MEGAAVIIETGGRKLAASMSSMPHGIQYITGNNFNGHFDVHFKNSTRHVTEITPPIRADQDSGGV